MKNVSNSAEIFNDSSQKGYDSAGTEYSVDSEAGSFAMTPIVTDEDLRLHRVSPLRTIEVVDEEDGTLPAGALGQLRVKIAGGLTGYYDDQEASDAFFRDGWFYPGDICVIDKRGILKLLGRSDDLINAGGSKISAVSAEEKLRAIQGVLDVAVFGITDTTGNVRAWAAIKATPQIDKIKLNDVAARASVSKVMFVEALPRNENGKVVKSVLREHGERLLKNGIKPDDRWFFYTAYYYAQGMYQRGEKYASESKKVVADVLLPLQSQQGWWEGRGGEERQGGKLYATSLAVLALSVKNHFLPIYQR